jgi:hypothetical protein
VDWENYSTIGVGRPQELITEQTLEKYRGSLALVIGIMGQRFGSSTGKAESGTEEEFLWAMNSYKLNGFPEIKWFFREIKNLDIPSEIKLAHEALEQWKKVLAFRERMQKIENPVFYTTYSSPAKFRDVLESDLTRWLSDPSRPWVPDRGTIPNGKSALFSPPIKYYENIVRDFHRLDIAGIDNDRTFEIPLSEIYVRLRVLLNEDSYDVLQENGPIDIQTALLRYPKLVVVGDPGSGKSTFLRYIALTLARSFLTCNIIDAQKKLSFKEPLPIPIFLSCWDLTDFLKHQEEARINTLIKFIVDRLNAYDYQISAENLEQQLLNSNNFYIMFDGLDEVPTDSGRATISRLIEDFVKQYEKSRFVVTSRIRAYTGDTILKGKFTRCEIQPFDNSDRVEFIRNWVALLFRIPPGEVEVKGSSAYQEFKSLSTGIEDSDRIRPLAVNPLLLTVIAIVHWNRKRLPDQRVDLYDECIDVLLGQRKEAVRIQISRKIKIVDEQIEERTHEERSWVRKRFAEIALFILSQDSEHDEATKADLIRLLVPRFIDQGAKSDEHAAIRAGRFLERQELRSGLLVSRRTQSYRFVHLTFQEYLATWQLSNMDFENVTKIIHPRLRSAKWFETLQLLGDQWAKESDEKVDRYILWLLQNRGNTINERAPVVALCANILKDTSGVAELKLKTRAEFRKAVEDTLDAFHKGSGVPAKTQLEILDVLSQLGPAVKDHLFTATRASTFDVRCRALQILLPYLTDNEVFSLKYILEDRSKEPIKIWLLEMFNRDPVRTQKLYFFEYVLYRNVRNALYDLFSTGKKCWIDSSQLCLAYPLTVSGNLDSSAHEKVLNALFDHKPKEWPKERRRRTIELINANSPGLRQLALKEICHNWPDITTRNLLVISATQDNSYNIRSLAIEALYKNWPDSITLNLYQDRINIISDLKQQLEEEI